MQQEVSRRLFWLRRWASRMLYSSECSMAKPAGEWYSEPSGDSSVEVLTNGIESYRVMHPDGDNLARKLNASPAPDPEAVWLL